MHKEVLARFDQTWLPLTAFIIFGVCFLVYLYWTFKNENKKYYEDSSFIVLEDGVKHER